jgi:hypothetical protein
MNIQRERFGVVFLRDLGSAGVQLGAAMFPNEAAYRRMQEEGLMISPDLVPLMEGVSRLAVEAIQESGIVAQMTKVRLAS